MNNEQIEKQMYIIKKDQYSPHFSKETYRGSLFPSDSTDLIESKINIGPSMYIEQEENIEPEGVIHSLLALNSLNTFGHLIFIP